MEQEPTLETRRIHEGRVLNLRVDTVRLPSGKTALREIVEHSGAVTIVPVDEDGNLLLVRQYRKAAGESLLEFPAGGIDAGEEPEACAQRELQEETGYAAAEVTSLGAFWMVPGYATEYMSVFLARGLHPSPRQGDEDEHIELERYPASEMPALVASGRIKDSKSIAALYLLDHAPRG